MTAQELKEYMDRYRRRLDVKMRTAELQREKYRNNEKYRERKKAMARLRYYENKQNNNPII